MKKQIFAVCDRERAYLGDLVDYLSRRGNLPFEIHAFTSTQALLDFAAKEEIALLLISASAFVERLREMNIGKIVLLSEGESTGQAAGYAAVNKYQSCAGILQETLAAYGETSLAPLPYVLAKKVSQIYGVYSPAGGSGVTTFALALGLELARRGPALFLSLEGNAGLRHLFSLPDTHTLSDLFYFARQRDSSLVLRCGTMVRAQEGLDLLPPVRLSEDLHEVRAEDIAFLLSELSHASVYEYFVVDVGREMGEIPQVLSLCDRIFLPEGRGLLAQLKREEFLESMGLLGYEELLAKIVPVNPPLRGEPMRKRGFAGALLWGEMGEAVRECLSREGV